jgi:hypothetical protein
VSYPILRYEILLEHANVFYNRLVKCGMIEFSLKSVHVPVEEQNPSGPMLGDGRIFLALCTLQSAESVGYQFPNFPQKGLSAVTLDKAQEMRQKIRRILALSGQACARSYFAPQLGSGGVGAGSAIPQAALTPATRSRITKSDEIPFNCGFVFEFPALCVFEEPHCSRSLSKVLFQNICRTNDCVR